MASNDGMYYRPPAKPQPVVGGDGFPIAAVALDHGHIYGMCDGLIQAGAQLKWVYDPDPAKVRAFCEQFPDARPARSEEEVLDDPAVRLVAAAAVPGERCPLGLRVMAAGKDYFTDKTPLVSLAQLEAVWEAVRRTGRKYMCYFSERLHVESAVYAGLLVEQGAIGRVLQVIGLGPHRLNAPSRPDWFFQKERYGGILCDIGSHQIEQMLFYTGASDASVGYSRVANYRHPDYPELEDFGDASLTMDNGSTGYLRVDWFTPDGLQTWGDGRTLLLGTDGFIELRKYMNLGDRSGGDHVLLANHEGESHLQVTGRVGTPFFGQLILDCLNRTETAMTQAHCLKAAELCVRAQLQAERLTAGQGSV